MFKQTVNRDQQGSHRKRKDPGVFNSSGGTSTSSGGTD